MSSDTDKMIELIQKQYFAMIPARLFQWPQASPANLSNDAHRPHKIETAPDALFDMEAQIAMVTRVFAHPHLVQFPPASPYAQSIAKAYYTQIETRKKDATDQFMDFYMELLYTASVDADNNNDDAAAASEWGYRTMRLPATLLSGAASGSSAAEPDKALAPAPDDEILLSMKESRNLISRGTTGLASWPAAYYLSEWLIAHRRYVKGRKILELGSGTGWVSLVACFLQPKSVLASDYDTHVLSCLRHNLDVNGCLIRKAVTGARVEDMDWYQSIQSYGGLQSYGVDLVLAADVVYDPDLLEPLCIVLFHLLTVPSYRRSKSTSPLVATEAAAAADDSDVTAFIGSRNAARVKRMLTSGPVALVASTLRNPEILQAFEDCLGKHALEYCVIEGSVPELFLYDRSLPVVLMAIQSTK